MKITTISVTISEAINVGKYESIKPSVTLTATLDETDGAKESAQTLHKEASAIWAKQALTELTWVAARREDGAEKESFAKTTEQTRHQIKALLARLEQ